VIVYVRRSRGNAKNSGFMIGSPVRTARRTSPEMYSCTVSASYVRVSFSGGGLPSEPPIMSVSTNG
jgi:hypothetical protein